jgi:hypothetical protein
MISLSPRFVLHPHGFGKGKNPIRKPLQPPVSNLNGHRRDNSTLSHGPRLCGTGEWEGAMSHEDLLGLLIGIGALAAMLGYLADVYLHPKRFQWLELQRVDGRLSPPPCLRRSHLK